MISSDVIRGHNDTIILAILVKGDSYGYQISKEIALRSENMYQIKVLPSKNQLLKTGACNPTMPTKREQQLGLTGNSSRISSRKGKYIITLNKVWPHRNVIELQLTCMKEKHKITQVVNHKIKSR